MNSLLSRKDFIFKYSFFGNNLGFGGGHNKLFNELSRPDRLLLLNPDSVVPYHIMRRLSSFADSHPDFGIVEARQIPLEHPKDFNHVTNETGWASGAASLYNTEAFESCQGFDETFFMYCEDVDLSWRLRAKGYKIYYCLDTFLYHSKELGREGIEVSESEQYYGLLSSLVLRAKYKHDYLNTPFLDWLNQYQNNALSQDILQAYYKTLESLEPAAPAEIAVAYFDMKGNFAPPRWTYQN